MPSEKGSFPQTPAGFVLWISDFSPDQPDYLLFKPELDFCLQVFFLDVCSLRNLGSVLLDKEMKALPVVLEIRRRDELAGEMKFSRPAFSFKRCRLDPTSTSLPGARRLGFAARGIPDLSVVASLTCVRWHVGGPCSGRETCLRDWSQTSWLSGGHCACWFACGPSPGLGCSRQPWFVKRCTRGPRAE